MFSGGVAEILVRTGSLNPAIGFVVLNNR
jgi:hypothetical protein